MGSVSERSRIERAMVPRVQSVSRSKATRPSSSTISIAVAAGARACSMRAGDRVEPLGDGGERGERLELRDDQREGAQDRANAIADCVTTPNSTLPCMYRAAPRSGAGRAGSGSCSRW